MNITKFVENEFKLLKNNATLKPFKQPFMDIVKIMNKQGHSGFSASYTASVLSSALKKTIKL